MVRILLVTFLDKLFITCQQTA